jgi:flagellar motility protein MotE (MotC chaperone)
MKIHARVEQINKQIEDANLQKQRATTQVERDEAFETLKLLKAEKRQLERLEKRYSPNQLKALEAMDML